MVGHHLLAKHHKFSQANPRPNSSSSSSSNNNMMSTGDPLAQPPQKFTPETVASLPPPGKCCVTVCCVTVRCVVLCCVVLCCVVFRYCTHCAIVLLFEDDNYMITC